MTIRALLDATIARQAQAIAMRFRQDGAWTSRTYAELQLRIRQIAEVVGRMEVVPGRDTVALILENRPEWIEIYAALAGAGITVVPVDPKLRPPEIAFILADAEARAVFTSERLRSPLAGILPELPNLRHVVLLDADPAAPDGASCAGRPCQDLAAAMRAAADAAARPDAWFVRQAPAPETLASIIYTSGTTGKPKGAMLTHANFCADVSGALEIISFVNARDNFLVVLPLFHAFSFTTNFLVPFSRGCSISFVESLRTVGEDLRTLCPTVVMAVPLLAEKIYNRIETGLQGSRLARVLLTVGLGAVVRAQVRKMLGGRLRLMVVGGAPCPLRILQGFKRLGIPAVEGYGLTEASPVVTLAHPKRARPGTIGYKLPNIEVRIADGDAQGVGELQVKGPIVMRGYYRNPAASAEAFDGPWLRTGDLASIEADGHIVIRGRKKALIVNREGKNIYPEEVEQQIASHPYVHDIIVLGYHEDDASGERVGAIVVPELDAIRAAQGGREPAWSEIETLMREVVQERCRDLADYKHPRKLEIRRTPLERTSTQKVRRHVYQGALDAR